MYKEHSSCTSEFVRLVDTSTSALPAFLYIRVAIYPYPISQFLLIPYLSVKMMPKTLFVAAAMAIGANAHFHLLEPYWRGSSFEEPASQWIYPCANVNETTDMANRASHPSPLHASN